MPIEIQKSRPSVRRLAGLCLALGLLGCTPPSNGTPTLSDASPALDPVLAAAATVAAPAGAAPNTCWARADSSAAVRTTVKDVEVVPPEYDRLGTLVRPGIYRREEVRELVRPEEGQLFEIPCPATTVPDFTASLQRALAVRGMFIGPVTGQNDRATRAAIRAYQSGFGIDSAQVSRRMAEELGLATVAR